MQRPSKAPQTPPPTARLLVNVYNLSGEKLVTFSQNVSSEGKDKWEEMNIGLTAKADVQVEISCENTSNITPTFFDDLSVKVQAVPTVLVVQENHYYPFGLGMKGLDWVLPNGKENKYQYNDGTEKNTDFDLNLYETDFRPYDPQIGRMTGVDALADEFAGVTPYNYAFNNPINLNDPSGLCPNCKTWQDVYNTAQNDPSKLQAGTYINSGDGGFAHVESGTKILEPTVVEGNANSGFSHAEGNSNKNWLNDRIWGNNSQYQFRRGYENEAEKWHPLAEAMTMLIPTEGAFYALGRGLSVLGQLYKGVKYTQKGVFYSGLPLNTNVPSLTWSKGANPFQKGVYDMTVSGSTYTGRYIGQSSFIRVRMWYHQNAPWSRFYGHDINISRVLGMSGSTKLEREIIEQWQINRIGINNLAHIVNIRLQKATACITFGIISL
ncbi:MAG: hypothetical protein EAZ53_17220 [Bacteroidetes bacterium]|nr:MAG: hypothetical protein EAZ53_17220 [Bacteroidota bacterium]